MGELKDEYLGPAFIRKFDEGDILYGSRRTYLRKVCIAPFEGITSNTTFVIKANDELVDTRLLPFVMLSEGFSEHSIRNSKGSVNPYVNWKDLADYEFLLPPKDQQAELAELFWGMDEVIERAIALKERIAEVKRAAFKHTVFSHSEETDRNFWKSKSNFAVNKLGDLIVELQYGISESLSEDKGIPVLRMNNLQDGRLDLSDLKYFNNSNSNGCLNKFKLQKGDVLFNRTNSFDLVGKVSLFTESGEYSFASYLLRIKTNDEVLDSRFLNFFLNSPFGMAKIRRYRTPGVSQSNINAQNLKNIPIPTPGIDIQKELMDRIEVVEAAEMNLGKKISSSKTLFKSLINQVF